MMDFDQPQNLDQKLGKMEVRSLFQATDSSYQIYTKRHETLSYLSMAEHPVLGRRLLFVCAMHCASSVLSKCYPHLSSMKFFPLYLSFVMHLFHLYWNERSKQDYVNCSETRTLSLFLSLNSIIKKKKTSTHNNKNIVCKHIQLDRTLLISSTDDVRHVPKEPIYTSSQKHKHAIKTFLTCILCHFTAGLQPPRFTIQPSSAGPTVIERRNKILQCHALGEFFGSLFGDLIEIMRFFDLFLWYDRYFWVTYGLEVIIAFRALWYKFGRGSETSFGVTISKAQRVNSAD